MRPRLTPVLAGERFLQMWRTAGGNSDGGIQRTADAADAGSCGRDAGQRFFEFRGLRTESRMAESVDAAGCRRRFGRRDSADVGNCRREAGCGNDL